MENGNLPGFLRAGPKRLKFYLKDMIYCFKNYEILTVRKRKKEIFSLPSRRISGENFSQSEYVAVGAIFQFAFLTLTRSDPSCVPLCKSFEHMWQTRVPFHKSFERQFLYSHSISSNPHVLLAEAPTSFPGP